MPFASLMYDPSTIGVELAETITSAIPDIIAASFVGKTEIPLPASHVTMITRKKGKCDISSSEIYLTIWSKSSEQREKNKDVIAKEISRRIRNITGASRRLSNEVCLILGSMGFADSD